MDFYPFQDVPGLLTPQMQGNVRSQSLLSAAGGLLDASGWSNTPPSLGSILGAGIKGGVRGYEEGTNNAVRQSLFRAQMQKLLTDQALKQQQLQQWQSIFGPGGGDAPAPAAPSGGGGGQPPGLITPTAPATTLPNGTPLTPENSGSMVGAPGERILSVDAAPAPTPAAPVQPTVTQPAVRGGPPGGLRQTVRELPPALRNLIGLAGPQKGIDILAKRLTDKPSDSFVTVQSPDGKSVDYRADDTRLDQAIASGWKVIARATPSQNVITLQMPDMTTKAFREGSAEVDAAIKAGATPIGTPTERKPDNYLTPDGDIVLSVDGKGLPKGSYKVDPTVAFEVSRQAKVQSRATKELSTEGPMTPRPPAEGPTKEGVGPWSNFQGAVNAVAGGAGVDAAFGKNGIWPENAANRDYLNGIKQVAKTALVNNPRFPVSEQKNIDALFPDPKEFWANPRTEVNKIPIIRNMLKENLATNNEAIAGGGLTKDEQSRYTTNNVEIKRALRILGEGDSGLQSLGGGKDQARAPAAQPGTWGAVGVGEVVGQGGKFWQKQSDGSAKEVPAPPPLPNTRVR